MLNRRVFLTSLTALALSTSVAFAQETLKIAFIPQENPEKLLGDIDVITSWMGEQLGQPVLGFVTFDHAAAVEALRNGDADISFMGALPFVLAEAEMGAEPLVSEIYRGYPSYAGRIFVRNDSGIDTLADLKGRDIAFADPVSESGYLYPLDLFVEEGLFEGTRGADNFFGNIFFAGGYQQAMQAMANGLVDAAGASQYADMLLTPNQQAEIKVIGESVQIPSHAVIARPDLDEDIKARFTTMMMSLNSPENQHLLTYLYGPDGYAVSDVAAYEGVREKAKKYGLLR